MDDEDNIELEPQEEESENIELLNANEGGVQRSKRITTRYMTKYVVCNIECIQVASFHNVLYNLRFVLDTKGQES